MRWDEALGSFDEVVAVNHYAEMYWFPHTDHVLVKTDDGVEHTVSAGDVIHLRPTA